MRWPWFVSAGRLAMVLVEPGGATRATLRDPAVPSLVAGMLLVCGLLGVATLPRQLHELSQTLAPVGDSPLDARHLILWPGLVRLMVVDRLVPSPTLLVACLVLVGLAEPVLVLPRDRRPALWSVAILGLAPLMVQRIGELVITYVAPGSAVLSPGEILRLPHQFVTGPLLFWTPQSPPPWAHILDARLNLLALWCVSLWALGLRGLDGDRLEPWHVAVPLAALGTGGILTWILTQPVVLFILGRP